MRNTVLTTFYSLIQLRFMSSNINNSADVRLLATYGTLRDDDNSGAAWTKPFVQDISNATTGRVAGYQLFGHPTIEYPFAIFTGNPNDSIVVRLLSWSTKEQFEEKIRVADVIEGDAYERKVVEASTTDGTKLAYIYVSATISLDKNWKVIPSGDWLQRHLT